MDIPTSRIHMHIKEWIFFLYTDLIWVSDTWKNPSIMKKKRRWVQIQRPLLIKIPTFCAPSSFLGKIKSWYMKEKGKYGEEEKEGWLRKYINQVGLSPFQSPTPRFLFIKTKTKKIWNLGKSVLRPRTKEKSKENDMCG